MGVLIPIPSSFGRDRTGRDDVYRALWRLEGARQAPFISIARSRTEDSGIGDSPLGGLMVSCDEISTALHAACYKCTEEPGPYAASPSLCQGPEDVWG